MNYGYVPGFVSPDGEELDAYIVGPDQPVRELEGEVVAVVLREDDIEDKLIVSDSRRHSRADLERAVHFQERYFASSVVVGPPSQV